MCTVLTYHKKSAPLITIIFFFQKEKPQRRRPGSDSRLKDERGNRRERDNRVNDSERFDRSENPQSTDGPVGANPDEPMFDSFGGQGIHVAPPFPSDIAPPPVLMPVPGAGYVHLLHGLVFVLRWLYSPYEINLFGVNNEQSLIILLVQKAVTIFPWVLKKSDSFLKLRISSFKKFQFVAFKKFLIPKSDFFLIKKGIPTGSWVSFQLNIWLCFQSTGPFCSCTP